MKVYKGITAFALLIICLAGRAQATSSPPKGKLFIIGGGDRPPALMQALTAVAALQANDYVVVLPMSSAFPDTSFIYFKADLEPVCKNPIVNLNFTTSDVTNQRWLDSLKKAKLIFITGGDQDRFMNVVMNTPVYEAIHTAYQNGATIAGTSAGAAVMSEHMITGRELSDTVYRSTFPKLKDKNIEFKPGLALLTNAVIDQHFIVRSRYNRLLSALASFPRLSCIGIDEATAIVVQGNKARVAGEGQVIVLEQPDELKIDSKGLIKLKDLRFSIYTSGDEFDLGTK